jgi:hypothetical protein
MAVFPLGCIHAGAAPQIARLWTESNVPHADGLLTGLGCEVNEAGFVAVDATGGPAPWVCGQPATWSIRALR